MRQYVIAGHTIQLSGKGTQSFPGFDFFSVEKVDNEPLLIIDTEAIVKDWAISPFFSYGQFERTFYDLSILDKAYLFRMKLSDDNYLQAKISQESNSFQAVVWEKGVINNFWLKSVYELLFNIAALSRQTISIHASTVIAHGKSVLFLGESGTGKSTQTGLWLQHIPGAELLNDDRPFIRVESGGDIRVYGSPWSGKTPCYKNRNTPIAAFVRLSQAPYNRIRRLKGAEAIGALLPSLPFTALYKKNLSEPIYSIISQTLQQAPVYHLECLPDADAVELVYATLMQDRFLCR